MQNIALNQNFFARPPLEVAPDLLGKFIVRKRGDETVALKITEVEAYEGPEDLASHARFGSKGRSAVMYGPPGVLYIFMIYGMHSMINVVTGEVDHPSAILIRGTEEVSGPGRLAKFLEVGRELNHEIAAPESGLWFEDRGLVVEASEIKKTPRVGVDYAGPIWSQKLYRFVLNPEKT